MKDEDLLAAVRNHVRSEQEHDAELEAVARGERASAALTEDPELRAMAEAAAPRGEVLEAKVLARVQPATKARPRAPSIFTRVGRYVGPIALAAALLVWIGTRGGGEEEGPLLPAYSLAAHGAEATRGEATESARLRVAKGSRFELLVRPEVAAAGKVAAWVFTVGVGSEEPTPLAAKVEVAPEGAVRVRGAGEDLVGVREIRVVLAPATSGTKFDAAAARARSGASDAKIRVLTVVVEHAAP